MKRYFYESKFAEFILRLSYCTTIAIGPLVFSKKPEDRILQAVRNHETIHAIQWTEVTAIACCLIFLLQILFGLSAWWLLLAPVAYYIWYVVEWLVKLAILQDSGTAYKSVCFEMEAYDNQHDCNYIENRRMVTPWLNRILTTIIG